MIIKGGSRSGPTQLARHLQRADTNERVEIIELQSAHPDLREALRDWQTIAEGTRGNKGLYHANIDPDARYTMTADQWRQAVDTLEKELGLTGQPRAVVLHEKHGRQHVHVVWQRASLDTMTLVSDSNNYRAHERASMALEEAFGHEHVPGKHVKRDLEQPAPKADITHAEWQQAERTGIDPRDLKDTVTELFRQSDNAQALKTALEDYGFLVARGDRRDYVIVDEQGEVHSLARQIKGATAKDLRAFMATIDADTIPNVEQAKGLQRDNAQRRTETPAPAAEPPAPSATQQPMPEPPKPPPGASNEELARLQTSLQTRHEEETRRLRERQNAERAEAAAVREHVASEKLRDLDARHKADLAAIARKEKTYSDSWLRRFIEIIKHRWNPAAAEQQRLERQQKIDAIHTRNRIERETLIATLKMQHAQEKEDLSARHAHQRREHHAVYQTELDRYAREHEAAQRLLAEIEEQRRQQQLDAEQKRTRDGPPDTRGR